MAIDAPRILVIRLSSMGDIILTTPALAALKAHYPQAELDFVVKDRYADILRGHPHVHRLFVLSPKDGLFSLGRQIRGRRHRILVDLHANLRSRLLTAMLPIPVKIRYDKWTRRRRSMVCGKFRPRELPHVVDRYLECLKPLGIEASRDRPHLFLKGEDERWGDEFLQRVEVSPGQSLVGMHPGARWPGKRWPADRFSQLGRDLHKALGLRILVFGGPGEESLAHQVAAAIGPSAVAAVGLTLRQCMAVISRCALFVTNDSGPMHLATALDVPVTAIFGPTHPMLGFWPLGDDDVFLTAGLDCSPCSLHGEGRCPHGWSCLQSIRVQDVLEAALSILDRKRRSFHESKNDPADAR